MDMEERAGYNAIRSLAPSVLHDARSKVVEQRVFIGRNEYDGVLALTLVEGERR